MKERAQVGREGAGLPSDWWHRPGEPPGEPVPQVAPGQGMGRALQGQRHGTVQRYQVSSVSLVIRASAFKGFTPILIYIYIYI